MQEGFTPAQHDTHWTHIVAELQARCDVLAAAGAAEATTLTLPFCDLHHDTSLLFRQGHLVLNWTATADRIYADLHPPPAAAVPLLAAGSAPSAGRSWARIVESNTLTPGALRLAAVLRAAPLLPVVSGAPFQCSRCSAPCPGWGVHLMTDCLPGFSSENVDPPGGRYCGRAPIYDTPPRGSGS